MYSAALLISKGFEGKERTDMEGLLKAGAAGFTDDGIPLMDGPVCKRGNGRGSETGYCFKLP